MFSHCFEFTSKPRALLFRLWQFLPWSFGLNNPYIHLDMVLNSLVCMQPLTRNLAPRLTNLPSQVPICSWVERSNAAWSALLRGTTNWNSGRVLCAINAHDLVCYYMLRKVHGPFYLTEFNITFVCQHHFDGLVGDYSVSSASAMAIL